MRRPLVYIGSLLLVGFAAVAQSSPPGAAYGQVHADWRVRALYVNGGDYRGHDQYRGPGPLDRGPGFSCNYYSLYLVEVFPGRQYTLGLSYPRAIPHVGVSLYDRWPYAPGARRMDLPLGPFVATRAASLEYRWQLGVSARSTSTQLYVAVATDRCDPAMLSLPYRLSIAYPPVAPGAALGRGMTYLQGPGDWMIVGETVPASYVIEETAPRDVIASLQRVPLPGDLIRNGWFADGLSGWQLHKNYQATPDADGVSVHDGGLRIASANEKDRIGVLQKIDKDVSGARSLILRAKLRVDRQAEPGTGTGNRNAPVAIAVCYDDEKGASHCGENALWMGFYSLIPNEASEARNGHKVPRGLWYRYVADLSQLDPRPKIIRYVSLEGAGLAEREGWIRDVHLIETGGKP